MENGATSVTVYGSDLEEGEIVCLNRQQLHNLLMLMNKEKRRVVKLQSGNSGVYFMLDQKDGGRRVWSLFDMPQHDKQL